MHNFVTRLVRFEYLAASRSKSSRRTLSVHRGIAYFRRMSVNQIKNVYRFCVVPATGIRSETISRDDLKASGAKRSRSARSMRPRHEHASKCARRVRSKEKRRRLWDRFSSTVYGNIGSGNDFRSPSCLRLASQGLRLLRRTPARERDAAYERDAIGGMKG